jgi:TRAP-type mannitol/chloroaromatic compound transport system permease small subunit
MKGAAMGLFLQAIDFLSEWIGKAVSWLILALTFVLVFEVIARYILESPTVFAYDSTWMIFGIYTILGAAYTYYAGGHVRIDFLYDRLGTRAKAILEIILHLIFFFPLFLVLSISCTEFALLSWAGDERSSVSLWQPPVYPFKIAMMIGFYLLTLQGIAKFIRHLYTTAKGKP